MPVHTLTSKRVLEGVLGLHGFLPLIALKQIISTYSNVCCSTALSEGRVVFTALLEMPWAAFCRRWVQHAAHTGARSGDVQGVRALFTLQVPSVNTEESVLKSKTGA